MSESVSSSSSERGLLLPTARGRKSVRFSNSVNFADVVPLADTDSLVDVDEPAAEDTRYAKLVSVIYLLAMVGLGSCYGAQGPATLQLAKQTGLIHGNVTAKDVSNLPILGIVNGADSLGGILGTLFGGWLVDRLDRWHPVLAAYLLWQGLAFMGFTFVTNLPGLVAVSMAWGLTSTMPTLSTQAAMTWIWGSQVGLALQWNNAAFGVGAVIAPVLVSWDLRTSGTFHRTYWAIAAVNGVAAVLPLLVKSPSKNEGHHHRAIAITNDQLQDQGSTLSNAKQRPPISFFAFFGVYVMSEIGLANWIATFATVNGVDDQADSALFSAGFYAAFTATRILAGPLSWYLASRQIVLICLVCGTASAALLIMAQVQASRLLLWCFVVVFGCFAGPMWPGMLSVVTEDYGVQISAKHMAFVMSSAKIGIFGCQFLFSFLLSNPDRGKYFSYAFLSILVATTVNGVWVMYYALPSQWKPLTDKR